MNTLTHVLAAGVIAESASKLADKPGRKAAVVVAAFFIGIVSHLALDAVPHFNWIAHLKLWQSLPYHWIARSAIFGFLAAVPLVFFASCRMVTVAALAGAVYPDVEKMAYAELHIWPKQWVLLKAHGLATHSNDGHLPYPWLITADILLLMLMLWAWIRVRLGPRSKP